MDHERMRHVRDGRDFERLWYWRGFAVGVGATLALVAVIAAGVIAAGVYR
jgi:hypothetical protein